MPESEPLISVIMGVCYRRDNTALLERSIQSIIDQTYTNWEFLICENGSTPAAQQCLRSFVVHDPRVRLVDGQGATTLAAKLNRCLAVATGKYIARMDDDDYSQPNRFQKQLDFMRKHRELAFVGSNVVLVRNGRIVGQRTFPPRPTTQDFFMIQPYIHPSLMFQREALDAVKGYSEDKHCILCDEYDLLLRMHEKSLFGANIPEFLLKYSIPVTAKGNRRMRHRWNEVITRYRRFRALGVLPGAAPYIIKPLIVGIIPESLLAWIKNRRMEAYKP